MKKNAKAASQKLAMNYHCIDIFIAIPSIISQTLKSFFSFFFWISFCLVTSLWTWMTHSAKLFFFAQIKHYYALSFFPPTWLTVWSNFPRFLIWLAWAKIAIHIRRNLCKNATTTFNLTYRFCLNKKSQCGHGTTQQQFKWSTVFQQWNWIVQREYMDWKRTLP